MAKIKFTGLISEIRGQLNDVIIQGWKSGIFSVKKMMSSVNNPNSAAQDAARSSMSTYSKKWTDTLTPAERAAWEAYALTEPGKFTKVPGVRQLIPTNGGTMSGLNAYVMANSLLINAGLASTTVAPIAATPPDKPTTVAATSAAGNIHVTWVDPVIAEPGARVRVWITSASGKFHKQMFDFVALGVMNMDIGNVKAALGHTLGVPLLVGELVYIQMDTINPTGGKSAGSNTAEVVIA